MTTSTGAGLYLAPTEKDPLKQNQIIRQLIEGRSNAVGSVSLSSGTATTTAVTAITCGPFSAVKLAPQTAHAAAAQTTTYVSSVTKGQFVISHASTASDTDYTFWYHIIG